MALATAVLPAKSGEKILTGRIRQFRQAPLTPMPLLPRAAATPATAVPWLSSTETGLALLLLVLKFQPLTSSMYPFASSSIPLPATSPGFTKMFAARSSCVFSTPSSTIAMTTALLPVVTSQAAGAFTSAPGVPPPCPVLFRCH